MAASHLKIGAVGQAVNSDEFLKWEADARRKKERSTKYGLQSHTAACCCPGSGRHSLPWRPLQKMIACEMLRDLVALSICKSSAQKWEGMLCVSASAPRLRNSRCLATSPPKHLAILPPASLAMIFQGALLWSYDSYVLIPRAPRGLRICAVLFVMQLGGPLKNRFELLAKFGGLVCRNSRLAREARQVHRVRTGKMSLGIQRV